MKELIQGCKDLERKAQREMVNHLSPFLYTICRRYAQNHEDAKDLLQESLIQVFNNIEKSNATEKGPFFSWCRRIAINIALAKKRKKGIQLEVICEAEVENTTPPGVHSQLNVADILKLLQFLSQNQQLVFNLATIDGYTHAKIAEILHIKESSSRTILVRARQSLQQLIQKQEID